MNKLTELKIKELKKGECFNVQTLFNVKNQDIIDFIENNNVCDMVFKLLPNVLNGLQKKYIAIGIYSDGHIELS